MMKRALPLVVGAALALSLTACDSASSSDTGDGSTAAASIPEPSRVAEACEGKNGTLKVGLVTINLQALFFNQINTAAQKIADRTGVDLQIISGNDDSVTQANAFDNLIASGVDAIIVDAIDTDGIKPSIVKADAAGIPVVAVDAVVDDPALSTQVGTANEEGGKQIGATLTEMSGGTGTVGIVGALNSTVQLERQKGFTDTVSAAGMTVGTVVDGRNIQENAQAAAENLLTGNPDMEYVYATGEPALIGLVAAVNSQNAQDRVQAVGWDLSDQAVSALNAGWLKGVVQQNTFEFGYEAMNAAIDLGCGREAPADIPVPTQIVTPDNVDDYLYYLEK
ncbi:substrate-binding domain-containing protein [Rhodococcus sp. BP-252]|uniref:ABC transporter substrate-binding protein n=1 Tax=Rhodococcoides kyotonense TaxID=398843 RepID=A0A177YES5_9NOCA|nr:MULTISPECIES: substrate-binding domain-containing protein [Rhodococcus]MBY6411537.1 substrate-binding domain-containing protein [Rhodococcus sp. BP-320]MBY6417919.1 substrate-binding domain-containing protein [Rhodococcus sp. BP-321]MBY6422180.1 substrate-binding domain-containing protein [Rhodococcus sp. BP-324]MBY6427717.1 substrate-binding domain-containing protein [Rhodococcus sp. BP-323]MBY6433064.1 substrate-binding domain-containing protein [Rhodococcus sp. BP-322]